MWTYGIILILIAALIGLASKAEADVLELRSEVRRLQTGTAISIETEIAQTVMLIADSVLVGAPSGSTGVARQLVERRVRYFDEELLKKGLIRMTDITLEQFDSGVIAPLASAVRISCGVIRRWAVPPGGKIVMDGRIVQLGEPVDMATIPHHVVHVPDFF